MDILNKEECDFNNPTSVLNFMLIELHKIKKLQLDGSDVKAYNRTCWLMAQLDKARHVMEMARDES